MDILLTVVIITGIAGTLAILLTLANSFIANYGECKIIINDEKEYVVEGGSTLLSSLRDNEVFIPSACGGKGSCAYCKVKVIEGGGPILSTELPYLSKEEKLENIRLSCQCKVREDIKVEIPEELLNVKEYTAVVEEILDVSSKIKYLKLELISPKEITFKPGQYIQLMSPQYEGCNEEVYRAYSLASSPTDRNHIELLIGYVPQGVCTTYVHQHLKPGDEVLFNGPYGDFYLQNSEEDILLVAAGTGMAPIRSILHQLKNKATGKKVQFFFGARTLDDMILMEEIKDLERTIPDFTFIPCLSRPRPEDKWTGEIGRVTDLIEKYLDKGSGIEAYLCGGNAMIQSTIDELKKKGISEEKIFYDKFD